MSDLRLSLAPKITTRDGTLTKDSLMQNFTREDREGTVLAIKRPGYSVRFTPPAVQPGQGMFNLNNVAYSISNETIYRLSDGVGFALPAAGANLIMDIVSDASVGGVLKAVIKSRTRMWVFDGAVVTQVTDPDYPTGTVRGLVLIDGTYYVMDPKGIIYGSAIQDPTSWNALNFIGTDQTLGQGIRLCRHLNYCFALCDQGSQAFYNNANPPPGSPLSPAGNATYLIGCANANSVIALDDLTIFMSKPKQRGRSVTALQGLSLVTLSTPYVDKILNRDTSDDVQALGLKVQGHSYYILTLRGLGITLVCDLVSKEWSTWTSADPASVFDEFPFMYYLSEAISSGLNRRDLIQHFQSGVVMEVDPTLYQDAGLPITGLIRTTIYDGQTSLYKFFTELNVIGDQASTTVEIRYSDDDYQTWSAWRTVSMNNDRKMLRSLGRGRRRAFEVRHTDNAPLRLEGMDFELYLGQS